VQVKPLSIGGKIGVPALPYCFVKNVLIVEIEDE
jgi:hypothetical protein